MRLSQKIKTAGDKKEPVLVTHPTMPAEKLRPRSETVIFDRNGVVAINKGNYLLMPGGGIAEGKTPRDAAIQEALEEADVDILNIEQRDVVKTKWDENRKFSPGWDGEETHFFLALNGKNAGMNHPDKEGFVIIPFNEAIGILQQLIDDPNELWAKKNNQVRMAIIKDARRIARYKYGVTPNKYASYETKCPGIIKEAIDINDLPKIYGKYKIEGGDRYQTNTRDNVIKAPIGEQYAKAREEFYSRYITPTIKVKETTPGMSVMGMQVVKPVHKIVEKKIDLTPHIPSIEKAILAHEGIENQPARFNRSVAFPTHAGPDVLLRENNLMANLSGEGADKVRLFFKTMRAGNEENIIKTVAEQEGIKDWNYGQHLSRGERVKIGNRLNRIMEANKYERPIFSLFGTPIHVGNDNQLKRLTRIKNIGEDIKRKVMREGERDLFEKKWKARRDAFRNKAYDWKLPTEIREKYQRRLESSPTSYEAWDRVSKYTVPKSYYDTPQAKRVDRVLEMLTKNMKTFRL